MEKQELMHSSTLKHEIMAIKDKNTVADLLALLMLAENVVTTSYDDQQQAISELYEFLS